MPDRDARDGADGVAFGAIASSSSSSSPAETASSPPPPLATLAPPPAPLGLPPAQFAAAFPFHLACDRALHVVAAGRALRRLCPALGAPAATLLAALRVREPAVLAGASALDFDTLARHIEQPFVLELPARGVLLRGQMIRLSDPDRLVFLGSPWLTEPGAVHALGLSLEDFAPHDPVLALLEALRAQQTALAEVRHLADKLTAQREALRARVAQAERFQRALLHIAAATGDTDFDTALRALLRSDADTLGVARVSYWALAGASAGEDDDAAAREGGALVCAALYDRARHAFEVGETLHAPDFPAYFAAMRAGGVLAAHDAYHDERTREFASAYLPAHGVGAMLDVPVFARAQLVGVICHEHVGGAREWSVDEQHFALSIGQLLSVALEARTRRRAEAALRESEARLRHSAFHDALTGLPNRAMFGELLAREVHRAARNPRQRFAVLFLDLDGFKHVNDSLGHEAGDELLVTIAARLRGCLRAGDVAARLGGDEFTVLLTDVADPAQATGVAERLLAALREPVAIRGRAIVPSASVGIVVSGPEYDHPDKILRDADAAMYRAKAQGKARYELFDPTMRESHPPG